VRRRVVPRHVHRPRGVPRQERFEEFGHFAPPLVPTHEHHRLPRVVVHRAEAVVPRRLPRRWDHHLPPLRAPHRPERGAPGDVELVGVVERLPRLQAVALLFNRLFLSSYSGSGLVTLCWGRESTTPPSLRSRRTVSCESRSPVSSAKKSASRWSVHSEKGRPRARGRRRTTPSSRVR